MDPTVTLCEKLVFVVNDEALIADTLGFILRGEGFTVRTFYDGLAAFEYAQQETPDIVLSDVVMPKMDGFILAHKLREQFPKCQILLISGNAYSSELLAKWKNDGAAELEILAKPIHPEILIGKIKAMAGVSVTSIKRCA